MKFKTRKRGTPGQVGKKFPVQEKKKLPTKLRLWQMDSNTVLGIMKRRKKGNKISSKAKPFIWYAGKKCVFETELTSGDEAQALIDYYQRIGYKAACLHERGKHQLYVEEPKHRGGKCSSSETKWRFYQYLKNRGLNEMEIADVLASYKGGGKKRRMKQKDFDAVYRALRDKTPPKVKYKNPDRWRDQK
jgi:hypothetical protein